MMSHIAKQAVDEYFDVLLTEPELAPRLKAVDAAPAAAEVAENSIHQRNVAQLLAKAQQQALEQKNVPEPPLRDQPEVAAKPETKLASSSAPATEAPAVAEAEPVATHSAVVAKPKAEGAATFEKAETSTGEARAKAEVAGPVEWLDELEDEFQCLYFKVAGLVLAVPLQLLGGIKPCGELRRLPGQPKWVLGQQIEREQAINAVDSCRWLMPDRYQQLAENIEYQYLVQLGSSRWAFACESLIDAEPLTKNEVRWRQQGDKRRYLAGIVKEKMCVVLDVPELIDLLDVGLDSKR